MEEQKKPAAEEIPVEEQAPAEPAEEKAARPEKPEEKKAKKNEHEKARAELEKLRHELTEQKDRFLRTAAEYDNYRKRTEREKSQSVEYGMSKVVMSLLPTLDNLERAAAAPCTDEEYKKGVTLTLRTFRDALTGLGVEPIEALGKPFDPEKHSAVQQLEAEGAESGTVTMELQRGYTLNGRVVRHAMVAVAP